MQRLLAGVLVVSLAAPLPAELAHGFTVFPWSIVACVLAIMWALETSQRPATGALRPLRLDPVLLCGGLLVASVLLSAVATGAELQYASLWGWGLLLYALARYRLPRLLERDAMAVALLVLTVGLAALGAVQVLTGRPVGALAQYFSRNVRAALVYEGVGGGALFKRVQGTFFSVDLFAMFIAYVFLLAFALAAASSRRSRAAAWTAGIAAFCIAFTFSRGVWIAVTLCTAGLLVALLAAGVLVPGRAVKTVVVGGVAIASLLVVAPDAVRARFESGQVRQSVAVRDNAVDVGWSVIGARPWFGVGYLEFVDASNELGLNPEKNQIRPHNVYVQLAAEQGVFVLLAHVALGLAIVADAARHWRRRTRAARAMAAGATATVVAWGIFALVYAQADEYSTVPMLLVACGYALGAPERWPGERAAAREPIDRLVRA